MPTTLDQKSGALKFLRVLPVISFPFILYHPAAVLCYWSTTNAISLCQVSTTSWGVSADELKCDEFSFLLYPVGLTGRLKHRQNRLILSTHHSIVGSPAEETTNSEKIESSANESDEDASEDGESKAAGSEHKKNIANHWQMKYFALSNSFAFQEDVRTDRRKDEWKGQWKKWAFCFASSSPWDCAVGKLLSCSGGQAR